MHYIPGVWTPILSLLSNLTFHDHVMATFLVLVVFSDWLLTFGNTSATSTTRQTEPKSLLFVSLFAGCLWRQLSTKHQSWLHYWWHHLCVFKTGAVPCFLTLDINGDFLWISVKLESSAPHPPGNLCFLPMLYRYFTKLRFLKLKKTLLFEGIFGLKLNKVYIQSQRIKKKPQYRIQK